MGQTIIHISTEVAPFYKRGGLGDVLGALPQHLSSDIISNIVFSPYFSGKMKGLDDVKPANGSMFIHGLEYDFDYSVLPLNNVTYYFINFSDHHLLADLEAPENGEQPYKGGSSYMYYLYFGKAILHLLEHHSIHPNYILCHDWQSSGILAFDLEMSIIKKRVATKVIYLIHNYEFQGEMTWSSVRYLPFEYKGVITAIFEKYGSASMLALGLEKSDHIATVSHSYAEELLTGRVPHKGLKYLHDVAIIQPFINGVDYSLWHPKHSPYIPAHFSYNTLFHKKKLKENIIRTCGWKNTDKDSQLLLLLSRLTLQKGIQLFIDIPEISNLKRLLESGAKLIICGTPGDGTNGRIHQELVSLQKRFNDCIYYDPDYTEKSAHNYLGAADMLLAPSLFEPCGLVQLYAMAFGTIPIARAVGGLKDTIIDHATHPDTSTGFLFQEFSFNALQHTIDQALGVFKDQSQVWDQIIERAMGTDFSWEKRVVNYIDFFNELNTSYELAD